MRIFSPQGTRPITQLNLSSSFYLLGAIVLTWTSANAQTANGQVLKPAIAPPLVSPTIIGTGDLIIPEVQLGADWVATENPDPSLNEVLFQLATLEVLGSPQNSASQIKRDQFVLRSSLIELMTKYGEKPFSQAMQIAEVKTWVACLCADAGDERAVPLLESMLGTIPQSSLKEADGTCAMYLLIRLSAYYEKKRDLAMAAQTHLRAEKYAQGFTMPTTPVDGPVPVAGMMANRIVEAARLYERAGEEDKARQTYARASKYGYGWASGMALYDQGLKLIKQGKHEDARRLLQQPVQGQYADQIKVGLLSALGESYYRTNDLNMASQYGEQSIKSYSALVKPLPGEGLEELVTTSRQRLEWIEKWKKSPLVCTASALRFKISPPASVASSVKEDAPKPVSQLLAVHALNDIPIKVTCSDARVQASLIGVGRQEEFSFVKKVSVEIKPTPSVPPASFDAVITITSPQFPTSSLQLPVRVEVALPK